MLNLSIKKIGNNVAVLIIFFENSSVNIHKNMYLYAK